MSSPHNNGIISPIVEPMRIPIQIDARMEKAPSKTVTAAAQSFRVTLRPQPVYAPTSLQPLVNFSFALKPLDAQNFGTGAMSFDLPLALCDALVFEDDPRRFTHGHQYAVVRVVAIGGPIESGRLEL
jgi:hypothetical protein